MNKENKISKISNAFSTGGGGHAFENNIQAIFLLALLVDGFCPIINERIKEVHFQAKHKEFDTDDVVLITDRNGINGKMLCQIKHSITVSEKNDEFEQVINAAWNDFNDQYFDKNNDRIVLAIAYVAVESQKALRFINEQAYYSIDERDFLDRIDQANYSNKKNSDILNVIKNNLIRANSGNMVSDRELWQFAKVFTLAIFDLDYTLSVNRTLAAALIKSKCKEDSFLVWARLTEYASRCDQNAASVSLDNIDNNIKSFFFKNTDNTITNMQINRIDDFIATIAVIGTWKDDNNNDQEIIQNIYGQSYDIFRGKVQDMYIQNPELIKFENGIWRVNHKKELIEQCRDFFRDDDIEKIFNIGLNIYKKNSVSNDEELRFQYYAGESYELRDSFIDSLCLIKYLNNDFTKCKGKTNEYCARKFVKELLHNCLGQQWMYFARYLPNVAELDPKTFIKEIESNITHNTDEFYKMISGEENSIYGQEESYIYLLWALEALAWLPEYIIPSVRCLGLLEGLNNSKTNLGRTPLDSITSVLHPNCPQTVANDEKQENALMCLKNDNSEVFWKVILALLPNHTFSIISNSHPRYMQLEIPQETIADAKAIKKKYSKYIKIAVECTGKDSDKIASLVDVIDFMDEESLLIFLGAMEKIDLSSSDENKYVLWKSLKEYIAVNENKDIKGHLDTIKNFKDKFEPENPCIRYKILYVDSICLQTSDDYYSAWEKLEQKKIDAIYEIYTNYGIKAIEKYGMDVNALYDVGNKFGRKATINNAAEVIEEFHHERITNDFFAAFISSYVNTAGFEVLQELLERFDSRFIAKILAFIPYKKELSNLINVFLTDDKCYWEQAIIQPVYRSDQMEDLRILIEKLPKSKRYITLLNVLGRSDFKKAIDKDDLAKLLKTAGTSESFTDEKIDAYTLCKLIRWLQEEKINIELLSDIEFIYLPFMKREYGIKPVALYARLSMDAAYFCSLIKQYYSEKKGEKRSRVKKSILSRLNKILFEYKIVPGNGNNGEFDENIFTEWMEYVKKWSKENDRYEVTMHKVGSGLSYSNSLGKKLPPDIIMNELDKAENDELRRGYFIGMLNQICNISFDVEGKKEQELADRFTKIAELAEKNRYSRYSELLTEIAEDLLYQSKLLRN